MIPLSPQREAALAARWQEYIPRVFFDSRKLDDPRLYRSHCEKLHRERFHHLAFFNIPMRTTRRWQLDSPFITEEEFERNLAAVRARREPRLGRLKGIRRTREEIHSNVTD